MRSRRWLVLLTFGIFLATACTSPPAPDPTATPTSTPTATPPAAEATESAPVETPSPTPTETPAAGSIPSACAGLSGELETHITVGPAEVVGLEPAAVGSIPFAVASDQAPYAVTGQGTLSYDDTLQKDWGTYSVSLDMQVTVDGTCTDEPGGAVLDLTLRMSGQQNVEVSAGEFQAEYPWSGDRTLNLRLPAQEGATAQGEGWLFVLHLN